MILWTNYIKCVLKKKEVTPGSSEMQMPTEDELVTEMLESSRKITGKEIKAFCPTELHLSSSHLNILL